MGYNKQTKPLIESFEVKLEKSPKNTKPPIPPPAAIPMKNKKQSSIEFLQEALFQTVLTHEQIMQTIGLFEQAKDMHKEEMLTAMNIAFRDGLYIADESYGESYKSPYDDWEDYYNKTFGGNNE